MDGIVAKAVDFNVHKAIRKVGKPNVTFGGTNIVFESDGKICSAAKQTKLSKVKY